MHFFDRPAAFYETFREVVEKLRMRRRFAEFAEVVGRAHQSFAEMILPDAVHHRTRGERVIRIGDPFRKFQTPATTSDGRLMFAGDDLEEVLGHGVAGAGWSGAN